MKARFLNSVAYSVFPRMTAEQIADVLSLAYRALRLNHLGTVN